MDSNRKYNLEKLNFLSRPSQLSDIEILQNVSGLVTTVPRILLSSPDRAMNSHNLGKPTSNMLYCTPLHCDNISDLIMTSLTQVKQYIDFKAALMQF